MLWLVKAGFYPQSYILYENHYDYSTYCFSTGTPYEIERATGNSSFSLTALTTPIRSVTKSSRAPISTKKRKRVNNLYIREFIKCIRKRAEKYWIVCNFVNSVFIYCQITIKNGRLSSNAIKSTVKHW